MPITIKSTELKYKNPSTGNYQGIDAVAETTTSQQCLLIENKGSEVLSSLPQTYTELSTSVTNLENRFDETEPIINKTLQATADADKVLYCSFTNGKTYTYTNNTDATSNLLLLRSDGTTKNISNSVMAGESLSFVIDENDFIGIKVHTNGAGSIDLTGNSSSNSLISLDAETAAYNAYDFGEINNITLFPGYISANGNYISADEEYFEVYTNKIPIENNYAFSFSLSYDEPQIMWAACALFNEAGTYIKRITIFDLQNIEITKSHDDAFFVIDDANAKYAIFTFRTFGSAVFSIKSANISKILNNKIELLSSVSNFNNNVRSVNHRGFNTLAPENTLPAFKLSKKLGFDCVECDVRYTSDSIAVLLHDSTINRTARNPDGSEISGSIDISSITYAQASEYDFGILKGSQYAGTKIPKLTDFLLLCKKIGLYAYIELKFTNATQAMVNAVINAVKSYGMADHVAYISGSSTVLGYVEENDNKARLGYVVSSITNAVISDAAALKTSYNEVFIDSSSYTTSEITLCKNANLPLEVWTINSINTIKALNPYITGVTSDSQHFGRIFYESGIG